MPLPCGDMCMTAQCAAHTKGHKLESEQQLGHQVAATTGSGAVGTEIRLPFPVATTAPAVPPWTRSSQNPALGPRLQPLQVSGHSSPLL